MPADSRTSTATWNLDFIYKDDKKTALENQVGTIKDDILKKLRESGENWDEDDLKNTIYTKRHTEYTSIKRYKGRDTQSRRRKIQRRRIHIFKYCFVDSYYSKYE